MSQAATERIDWQLESPNDSWPGNRISLRIGGVSLIERVGTYEAARGYRPAGGYSFLAAGRVRDLEQHFLGHGSRPQGSGRVTLLICACGIEGCWDLNGRITLTGERVAWSDFEQPCRRPGSRAGHWDYSGFGPFVFDRGQYVASLAAVAL